VGEVGSVSVEYFEKLLLEHGDSPRALDWSEEGQRKRFEVLRGVGIAHHSSVLDVGCGLGHFYDYLHQRGHVGMYEGVDASQGMIDAARANHADSYFSKVSEEWLFRPVTLPPVDFVVASGVLNVRPCVGQMETLIQRCFAASKIGCAINMLSERTPQKRRDRFYYSPAQQLATALDLTRRATLRHDYADNDFTLYLYKDGAK
jgi:predicted TPR repeat methyltransferase